MLVLVATKEMQGTIDSITQQNTGLQGQLTQSREGLANAIKDFDSNLEEKNEKITTILFP